MKILVQNKSGRKKPSTLIVFASRDFKGKKKQTLVLPKLHSSLSQLIQEASNEKSFEAEANESVFFRNYSQEGFKHALVIGLGDKKKISHETIRQASGTAFNGLRSRKLKEAGFDYEHVSSFLKDSHKAISAALEGFLLSEYQYIVTKTPPPPHLEVLTVLAKTPSASLKKIVKETTTLIECVNFARRLGDSPGNIITPKKLADETVKATKGTGLKVTVWDKARIKKEKMGGLYGVSLGSAAEPRFIIMEYNGAGKTKKPVCFVGKGLTFDSGGISIKPSAAMDEMKYDMCGGANVIATLLALAKLKIKVNAIGLVPASENMPGPLANKPGDILTARNGKTVEVLNTDAEGRLILMDALSYATEKKPAAIFDAATLTGAIVVALNNIHTGVFTRDEKTLAKIKKASEASGELIWPMPIHDQHVKDMKGIHADLANIGSSRGAGSSTAAAFLEQFVGEDIPWAHFDIAGTAWNVGNRLSYCGKKIASGVMVRTFVELAKQF